MNLEDLLAFTLVFMKTIFKILLSFIALATTFQSFSQHSSVLPKKLVDFASSDTWKGNPSFAKHNDYIYVLYTAMNNKGKICRYTISTGAIDWSDSLFDTVGEHDPSHNDSSIAVDGNGFIHCWIGMHNDPIKYYRSKTAGDFKNFESKNTEMPNYINTRASYPWACTSTNGDVFLIIRRSMKLDNEYQDLYHYSLDTKKWTMTTVAGKFGDSAYMSAIHADNDNNVHIATVWSDFHFHDNHFQRGTYLKYDVAKDAFFKADGTLVTNLPVQHDGYGADLFYENNFKWSEIEEIQTPRITTNDKNDPIIVYPFTPDNGGVWSYKMATWNDTQWMSKEVYSMGTRYGRPPVTADGNSIRIYATDVSEKQVYASYSGDNGLTFTSNNLVEKSDYVFAKMAINSNINNESTDFLISRRHLFKVSYVPSETPKETAVKNKDEIVLGDLLSTQVKKGFEGAGTYRIICKNGYKNIVQMEQDTYVRQNTLAKSNTQIWDIKVTENDYVSIHNKNSGNAIYSEGDVSAIGPRTKIDLKTKPFEANNDSFLWKIENAGFGYYHFINKANGLALVPGGHHGSTDVMEIMSTQHLRASYNEFNWLIVPVDTNGAIIIMEKEVATTTQENQVSPKAMDIETRGYTGRGYYAIKNNDNQCLSVKQGTVQLQFEDFEGKINQLWYINSSSRYELAIQNKMTDCVLTLKGDSITTNLSSNIPDPYLWQLAKNKKNITFLENGKLMATEAGVNTALSIANKSHSANEGWNLYAQNTNIPVPSAVVGGQFHGEYLVQNKQSKLYLRRELENFRASQHVFYGYTFHNGIWEIRHNGNDYYYFINKETGQLLIDNGLESKAYVQAYYQNTAFLWRITEVADGFFKIENKKTGRVLCITSNESGSHLDLKTFTLDAAMLWEVRK